MNNFVLVSGIQQNDSVIYIQLPILFQILFPLRLLHNIEQSSLCYAVGPCWLYILNIVVCIWLSQIPTLPLPPTLPPGNHKFTGALFETFKHQKTWRATNFFLPLFILHSQHLSKGHKLKLLSTLADSQAPKTSIKKSQNRTYPYS